MSVFQQNFIFAKTGVGPDLTCGLVSLPTPEIIILNVASLPLNQLNKDLWGCSLGINIKKKKTNSLNNSTLQLPLWNKVEVSDHRGLITQFYASSAGKQANRKQVLIKIDIIFYIQETIFYQRF